ncbi:MAG: fibrillarin-like rRNA/tRNA 2'-O-methyltransferase [Candidatus Hodarchaeaceae archaeon]|nr:fibrillarin-like rRNA/tRNA 2'-O-methyltransferase [Candidatus Hodarchaeaceae archaeon]MDI6884248.1 fibrillarin-like rRNA/tRNA 2'-O-methyltransferase [Hadesarchaea archaeon]
MKVTEHKRFESVYWVELDDGTRKLATVNLARGCQVYGERLVEVQGVEYRLWDPYRSKLAAAILKNIKEVPIGPGKRVLYLGAASGTTASHAADLVGQGGCVYCVEISSRPLRDLLVVCAKRPNMAPILADARHPCTYCALVEKVDVIYQDVAQPDQTDILLANVNAFLEEGGHAILALKARSIDVTKEPREIFRDEMEKLEKEMEIIDAKILDPYEKDHAMLVLRK